jgi:hypothetical protein
MRPLFLLTSMFNSVQTNTTKENFMRKGKFVPGILLLTSVIFLGMSVYVYQCKDDSEGKQAREIAGDAKGAAIDAKAGIISLTDAIKDAAEATKQLREEQKAFAAIQVPMMADLNSRVSTLEKRPPGHVKVSLTEPVRISLIYKAAQKKIEAPTATSTSTSKGKVNGKPAKDGTNRLNSTQPSP